MRVTRFRSIAAFAIFALTTVASGAGSLSAASAIPLMPARAAAVAVNGPLLLTKGSNLYTFNPDLTGGKKLTSTGKAAGGVFSPDGRLIAYSDTSTGNGDVYVMNRDGSGKRRVTTYAGRDDAPSWSPDGRRLAFTSCRNTTDSYLCDIYTVKSAIPYGAAVKLTQATDQATGGCEYITYSSAYFRPGTSGQLAVSGGCGYWSEPDDHLIWVFSPSGKELSSLALGYSMDWSPDGNQYVYDDAWNSADGYSHLVRSSLTGGRFDVTPEDPYNEAADVWSPVWSPDNKLIAFGTGRGTASSGTWFIRPDGTRKRLFLAGYSPTDWAKK